MNRKEAQRMAPFGSEMELSKAQYAHDSWIGSWAREDQLEIHTPEARFTYMKRPDFPDRLRLVEVDTGGDMYWRLDGIPAAQRPRS